MSKREIGIVGERSAIGFLLKAGYKILDGNFRSGHGEIDIVAHDGNELVFIEVKTRHGGGFGSPEEAVTEKKQRLLRRTAEGYVREKGIENVSCRFDVVAITLEDGKAKLVHYKNAF
jgi:putative endonuclease